MEIRERCYLISARDGGKRKLSENEVAMLAAEVEVLLGYGNNGVKVEIEDWKRDRVEDNATIARMRVLARIVSDVVVDSSVRMSAHAFNLEAVKIKE